MAKWWQNLINAIDFFDLYHTDTETEMRNPSQSWSSIDDGISKVYDDVTGNTAIDKSLEAQATENQKNRDYNMMLWNQDNAYNSPSAQKGRLQAAGLNADLMYGGSGVQNTSSSPTPSTPMDWSSLANKKSVGASAMEAAQVALLNAQAENLNADTKKKGYEAGILASDEAFRNAWNTGLLQLQGMDIRLKGKQGDLTDAQIKESMMSLQVMQQSIKESSARIQQIHNQINNDNMRVTFEKALADANVKKAAAETKLSHAKINEINQLLEKALRSYDDAHELHLQNIGILRIQQGQIEFDTWNNTSSEWDKDKSVWTNVLRYIDQFTNALDGILSPAASVTSAAIGRH